MHVMMIACGCSKDDDGGAGTRFYPLVRAAFSRPINCAIAAQQYAYPVFLGIGTLSRIMNTNETQYESYPDDGQVTRRVAVGMVRREH
jgi:hypothetical protein